MKEHIHERPHEYYDDEDWRSKQAPVFPPTRVVEEVKRTGKSVEWHNSRQLGGCYGCDWPMVYLSELQNGEVVTRLVPGSVRPVEGWLS